MSRISISALALFLALVGSCAFAGTQSNNTSSMTLMDQSRNRSIPLELYFPSKSKTCMAAHPCPVAILSAGYGISYREYSFLADELNDLGFLVVSINHELPADPRLNRNGNIRKQLKKLWQQGARNIAFVQNALSKSFPDFDWRHVVLVGHSIGGDSSAFRTSRDSASIAALITLDNRRAALPRTPAIKVLSVRAGDTQADPGVLPVIEEQRRFGSCIVKIDGSRHNDMHDGGSVALKEKIRHAVRLFLSKGSDGKALYSCDAPAPVSLDAAGIHSN